MKNTITNLAVAIASITSLSAFAETTQYQCQGAEHEYRVSIDLESPTSTASISMLSQDGSDALGAMSRLYKNLSVTFAPATSCVGEKAILSIDLSREFPEFPLQGEVATFVNCVSGGARGGKPYLIMQDTSRVQFPDGFERTEACVIVP